MLVEFAVGFSVLTFLLTRNPISALSVVVVAGACGVAAGTPLAIVAIMGKSAKKGAIIKGGAYVEEMNRIDTVVIDKTGTLTFGEPEVTDVVCFDGYTQRKVMEYAAFAERHSNHPIARAIIARATESGIVSDIHNSPSSNYVPGKGIVSELDGEEIIVGTSVLMMERNVELPRTSDGQLISDKTLNGKSRVLVAHAGKDLRHDCSIGQCERRKQEGDI